MDLQELERVLDSIPDCIVPGLDCIVTVDGKQVFRKMRGYSDYELTVPVSNKDRYWMYSCSKVITAVSVMRLIEQGKIGLYDEVERYLPEFAHPTYAKTALDVESSKTGYDPVSQEYKTVNTEKKDSEKSKMRIYDLLRMASGLSYDLTHEPTIRIVQDETLTTRQAAGLLAQVPLLFEPGEDFLYSMSLDVLGAVTEVVTGKTFGAYLRDEIFAPLGMEHTGFSTEDKDGYKMSAQYMMDDDQKKYHRLAMTNAYHPFSTFESGGGGIISTADDMSRFAQVMACGGTTEDGYTVISRETMELMTRDHLNEKQKESMHRNWPHLINYSYGLGVRTFIENRDGNGGTPGEFGWEGAAGSYFIIDPKNKMSCFYAQHVRKCSYATENIHRRITKALYCG